MAVDGFLLTRTWRDAPDGLQIELWAWSDAGPLRIRVPGAESRCWIERDEPLAAPEGVTREPTPMRLLGAGPVDALRSRRHGALRALRATGARLCESDIRPADRWLMDRGVRAGLRVTPSAGDGSKAGSGAVRTFVDPRVEPATVVPSLAVLSLDLEMRAGTDELYSIAGALAGGDERLARHRPAVPGRGVPAAAVFVVGAGAAERRDGYTLYGARDERHCLERFLAWLALVDPDVLTGWSVVQFDLNFLDAKCRALGVPFSLGRGGARAAVLQPDSPGGTRVARVPGRAVLDGIELVKAALPSFESYSLEAVSRELLGLGKRIAPEADKVGEINRLFRDDKARLADYNATDCTLVNDILERAALVEFAVARATLTGLPLDRLGGAAAAFDNLYLPALHARGVVAPDAVRAIEPPQSPGGHVMDSVPGLHENVLVLDFKSLYPSIVRTWLIDPLGLAEPGDDAVPGLGGASFAREGHILPGLLGELWAARDAARAAGDAPLAQAIKVLMNACYGVFGTDACRFFDLRLAGNIVRRGHEVITATRERVEAAGHRVIYGDTDSLFVVPAGPGAGTGAGTGAGDVLGPEAADALGAELARELDAWWREELRTRHGLESRLEIEFETRYARFLMPTLRGGRTGSKKRYAGLAVRPGAELELVIKGLEAVRGDWTPLARDFQRELLARVLVDGDWEAHVRQTRRALFAGELDDRLVYRRRLRRGGGEHPSRPPAHVQAARKLARPGNWVRYVVTRAGPEPVEALVSAPDHEHYAERQLGPAADAVLGALGTSFAALTDAQLGLF